MNELNKLLHVVVFLKKLRKMIDEDINGLRIFLTNSSNRTFYEPYNYNRIIMWIQSYPDRGILDLIIEKDEFLRKFTALQAKQDLMRQKSKNFS